MLVNMHLIKTKIFGTILAGVILSSVSGHDKKAPIPKSYDVVLYNIDMDKMSYEGQVTINVEIKEEINKIKLNSRNLEILSVIVKYNHKMKIEHQYELDMNHEELIIKSDSIADGSYLIDIQFRGTINNKSIGFFKTNCRLENNASWIGGVSLEPVNARSVFPSFDVNEEKVNVSVKLTLSTKLNVISNQMTSQTSGNMQTVELNFNQVQLDQVGWVIYPKDGLKFESVNGLGHKVLSCRSNWKWLEIIESMTKTMNHYTGTELSNIHWILMPDLPTPISSSIGINFIRDDLVEHSNFTSMPSDYNENMLSVAESYVQQWFGHITRPKYWSDLWLRKGISNFLKYKLIEQVDQNKNNFSSDEYILGNIMPRVLEREVIGHSLTKHADSKNDVLSLYDQDLFDRAGLILRMIEDRVGESAFKSAVLNYVNRTNGMDADHTHIFWESLSNASLNFPDSQSIYDVMKAWISSDGYPIITVKREGDFIIVSQQHSSKRAKTVNGYWWIPFTVTSDNTYPRKFWLRPTGSLKISLLQNQNGWYMINADGKGFYRVNYDIENWKKLNDAISNGELHDISKAKLMDDALGLAEDGHLSYSVGLGLTRHLSSERKLSIAWSAAMRHLVTVRRLLESSRRNNWDEYVSVLITNYILKNATSLEELIDDNESITKGMINEKLKLAFNKMGQTQDLCRENIYCIDLVNNFISLAQKMSYGNIYGGDMMDGIICLAIENTNSSIWENWSNVYMKNQSASLDSKIITGLSCTKNSTLQHKMLEMFIRKDSILKRQDFATFINKMISTEVTYPSQVVTLLLNHREKIQEYISEDQWMLTNIVLSFSEKIYDTLTITEVKRFITSWESSGILSHDRNHHQVHRAIRRIELNHNRRKRSSNEITTWLKNRNDEAADFIVSGSSSLIFSSHLIIIIAIHFIYHNLS